MTATLLRAGDPAAGLDPDPTSEDALRLLRTVVATPRRRPRRATIRPRSARRLAVATGLTAAAAVVGIVALRPDSGPSLGPAGYTVTKSHDGTVRAVMRWSMLSDPSRLQAALDRAGARMRVFVETDPPTSQLCAQPNTVGYSASAVEWHSPSDANTENGIVLHPQNFPKGATFVLVVTMAPAGSSGGTFAPGFPQITSTLSYMAVGPVSDPVC